MRPYGWYPPVSELSFTGHSLFLTVQTTSFHDAPSLSFLMGSSPLWYWLSWIKVHVSYLRLYWYWLSWFKVHVSYLRVYWYWLSWIKVHVSSLRVYWYRLSWIKVHVSYLRVYWYWLSWFKVHISYLRVYLKYVPGIHPMLVETGLIFTSYVQFSQTKCLLETLDHDK